MSVIPYPVTEQTRRGTRVVTRWAVLRDDGTVAVVCRREADALEIADAS